MAMALTGNNRHYKWIDLQRRYLVETAKSCGFDQPGEEVINEVIAETPHVIQKTAQALPGDFPATIAEPILKGLERAAASIAQ